MKHANNPQNPYISCVVRASAGCGKTYQLSRRFLFLVAAGASPNSILTITFTKKAASEMKERILLESAQLLKDETTRCDFDRTMEEFFKEQAHQLNIAKPRTAEETAKLILSTTQALNISTIDATFLEWVRMFPKESQGQREQSLSNQNEMAGNSQISLVNKLAWEKLCQDLYSEDPLKAMALTPFDIESRIQELTRKQTFAWLCQQLKGASFSPIPLPPGSENLPECEAQLVQSLESELRTIAEMCSPQRRDTVLLALQEKSISALVESRLLTRDYKISGATIRGKKRDSLANEILIVDESLGLFGNRRKIKELNELGSILCRLFDAYMIYRDRIKDRLGLMEFDDTAKGSYQLFSSLDNVGAHYLINRQTSHILLDEFQDTSNLQWSIFSKLCKEILSGQGIDRDEGLKPSVFIVGDEKQSIYGFREADANILINASSELAQYAIKEVPLNDSYRTSQGVLDLVNRSFRDMIEDFPAHQTATFPHNQKLAVPNHSSVAISPLFEDADAIEDEARFVADYIYYHLKENPLPVYDKNSKSLRTLKPKDCAILYRASTHVKVFERALRQRGIQSRREENKGFFERQEVRDAYHLLRFICYQSDLLSFTSFMKSPMIGMDDRDILEQLYQNKKNHIPRDTAKSIIQRLGETQAPLAKTILDLMEHGKNLSPSELFVTTLEQLNPISHYREAFEGAEADYAEANLQSFLELICDYEKQGAISLQQVLERLEDAMKEDSLGASSPSENAVNLMTIHKSKGLEFPLVAVIGLGEAWDKRDPYWVKRRDKDMGLSYIGNSQNRPKDDLNFDRIFNQVSEEDKDENQRLLYVALTRAKHHLLLSGSRTADSKKAVGFHQTLWESCEDLGAEMHTIESHQFLKLGVGLDVPINQQPRIEKEEQNPLLCHRAYDAPNLEIKTLAPNRLLNKGDFDHNQEGEQFHPYATEAGTYVHLALEKHIKEEPLDPSQAWMEFYQGGELNRFQEVGLLAHAQVQGVLNSELWRDLLNLGKLKTEMKVVHLDGNNLIRGSIDLLVSLEQNRFLVVDYKTSKPNESPELTCQNKGYDKQILAYVKAIKALYPGSKVNGGIYFTGQNTLTLTHQEFRSKELDLLLTGVPAGITTEVSLES